MVQTIEDAFENAYNLELSYMTVEKLIPRLNYLSDELERPVTIRDLNMAIPEKPREPAYKKPRMGKPQPPKKLDFNKKIRFVSVLKPARVIILSLVLSLAAMAVALILFVPSDSRNSFETILSYLNNAPMDYLFGALIGIGIGVGLTFLIHIIIWLVKQRKYFNAKNDYQYKVKSYEKLMAQYDEELRKISEENIRINEKYNHDIQEYNNNIAMLNHLVVERQSFVDNVKKPIVYAEIRKMLRTIEDVRMALDYIYHSYGLSPEYRDIVSAYVFLYYIKKSKTPGDIQSMILQYNKDYEQNLIPMSNELPDVKMVKKHVDELYTSFISNFNKVTDIGNGITSNVETYIKLIYNNIETSKAQM